MTHQDILDQVKAQQDWLQASRDLLDQVCTALDARLGTQGQGHITTGWDRSPLCSRVTRGYQLDCQSVDHSGHVIMPSLWFSIRREQDSKIETHEVVGCGKAENTRFNFEPNMWVVIEAKLAESVRQMLVQMGIPSVTPIMVEPKPVIQSNKAPTVWERLK